MRIQIHYHHNHNRTSDPSSSSNTSAKSKLRVLTSTITAKLHKPSTPNAPAIDAGYGTIHPNSEPFPDFEDASALMGVMMEEMPHCERHCPQYICWVAKRKMARGPRGMPKCSCPPAPGGRGIMMIGGPEWGPEYPMHRWVLDEIAQNHATREHRGEGTAP